MGEVSWDPGRAVLSRAEGRSHGLGEKRIFRESGFVISVFEFVHKQGTM